MQLKMKKGVQYNMQNKTGFTLKLAVLADSIFSNIDVFKALWLFFLTIAAIVAILFSIL